MNYDSDIPVVLGTNITLLLLLFTVDIILITIVDINFMVDIINLLLIVDIMVSVGCDSDIPTLSGAPASQATDRPPMATILEREKYKRQIQNKNPETGNTRPCQIGLFKYPGYMSVFCLWFLVSVSVFEIFDPCSCLTTIKFTAV